jgi:opacity protein-like surface antigen
MKRVSITSAIAVAAALLVPGVASAADIYGGVEGGGYKDNPGAYSRPAINWTGVYVGGQIGYGNSNHNLSVEQQVFVNDGCTGADADANGNCKNSLPVSNDTKGEIEFCESPDGTPSRATAPGTCASADQTIRKLAPGQKICTGGGSVNPNNGLCVEPVQLVSAEKLASVFIDGLNSSGVFGGGTIGADVQRGNVVVGVFADYNVSDARTEIGFNDVGLNVIEDGDSWVVAGRIGVLFGEEKRALLYGLAGYGQQDISYAFLGDNGFRKDVSHSGLVLGAGGEYALTQNVFIGIEYQHFFGSEEKIASFDNLRGDDVLNAGDTRTVIKDELDTDKVMGKLKVKFGGGLPSLK